MFHQNKLCLILSMGARRLLVGYRLLFFMFLGFLVVVDF